MTLFDSLLARGIAAAKAGDKATARDLLTRAVRRKPDSEQAWLWLSAVLDTPQGRAFCLRQVLALDPTNQRAQQGLAALENAPPAPILVAQPPRAMPTRRAEADWLSAMGDLVRRSFQQLPPLDHLVRQQRFWQVVVACLAIIALSLAGVLAYAAFSGARSAEGDALAAIAPTPTLGPRGTLRPTFTATPTHTPTPTDTPTPTHTPTSTFTPTPTDTPSPTPTPTPRPRRRVVPTATFTPTPRPTLPPRSWDPRLNPLGIRIEAAPASLGQPYWRLVDARWSDERESAGKHSIYVEVIDIYGRRVVGQPVIVQWAGSNVILPTENRPPPDWAVNFPMYNTLSSYAVSVGGAPSDRVVGMGLGTAAAPDYTIHTSFYLTFRWVEW